MIEHQKIEPRLLRSTAPVTTIPPGLVYVMAGSTIWSTALAPLFALFQSLPLGSQATFNGMGTTYTQKRMSAMCELMANHRLQWLLFVDGDQTPPINTLVRLWAWGEPIVGGTYVNRMLPHSIMACISDTPIVIVPSTPPLLPVDWMGLGCSLIRREVFAADPDAKWFRGDYLGMAEDHAFFTHARSLGFPIYLDTTLRIGHITPCSLIEGEDTPMFVEQPEEEMHLLPVTGDKS